MPTLRAHLLKKIVKHTALLQSSVTADNLEKKRHQYTKLTRFVRIPKGIKITPVNEEGFVAEWIDAPTSRPDIAMLYIHGGGFVFNSTEVHRELIARIAIAGRLRALSLDYSVAPEHPYPRAVNEALAAYKWLLATFPAEKIVVAGDSAGGMATLSLLHAVRENKLPYPACVVLLSPGTDASNVEEYIRKDAGKDIFLPPATLRFFIEAYYQKTPHDHPIASPYNGNLKGFPPILIHTTKSELLYHDAVRFVTKARKEKVNVTLYETEGLWHVWHMNARWVPEARKAIRHVGEFIQGHTGAEGSK